ncbi:MAG: zinc-dependent dehydrogenase [Planctomycetota bacterium]|jgi:L-iditol 2-dehydrogenase|nr:zinc-dependent dehydrogenase [Planctomycetota bacterium]
MKAALLKAPGDLQIVEAATPAAGPGDLVIRVEAAAFCGTDIRIINGKKKRGVRFPSIIGHEFSGVVVEAGVGVERFKPGDRVAADPVIPCRGCAYCRAGRENVCLNRKAIGYEYDGAFAEYLRIPAIALEAGNVLKLPDGMSFAAGALAEPLACVLNGQRNARVGLGDAVLILGSGPIGLMHLMLAKASGAGLVAVSEPNAERRRRALEMGADLAVDPAAENPGEAVRRRTGGLGADVAILAIGVPKLAADALGYVRKGGRVNLFAGFSTGDMGVLDVNLIHYNEIFVSGASALSRDGYEKAFKLIGGGAIPIEKLVSHRFRLDDVKDAAALAESGDALKILVRNG